MSREAAHDPALIRRLPLILLGGLAVLLAPLPWLGDLRTSSTPYLILALSSTVLLYGAMWLFRRWSVTPSAATVIAGAILLRLLMLPMSPSLSDDAYRYLWDGRLVLHGVNPYLYIPADPALKRFHDTLYRVQGYPTTNTIYPPAAQLGFAASMAIAEIAGSHMVGFLAWKLLLVMAEIVAIAMLIRTLGMVGIAPGAAALYAWHPLVIVELAGQGHTDAFWVLGLAAGLYWYAAGSAGSGLPAIALGVAARLHPASLIPLWWRFLGYRAAARGLVLAVPALLLLVPLFEPRAWATYSTVLERFTNFYEFNGGFYNTVKWLLDEWHIKPSNTIAGAVSSGTLAVTLLAIWLWPVRDRGVRALAWRALLAVTVQIVLGPKVHVWYFVAPLVLLPLVSRQTLRAAWLWVAGVAPLTYLYFASQPPGERLDVLIAEWGGFVVLAVYGLVRREPPTGNPEPAMEPSDSPT